MVANMPKPYHIPLNLVLSLKFERYINAEKNSKLCGAKS